MTANGYSLSFRGNEHVLELNRNSVMVLENTALYLLKEEFYGRCCSLMKKKYTEDKTVLANMPLLVFADSVCLL